MNYDLRHRIPRTSYDQSFWKSQNHLNCTTQLSTGLSLQSLRSRFFVDVVVGQQV